VSTIDTPVSHEREAPQPTPVKVTIYHNDEARFMPYEDGQLLNAVTSHWLDVPAGGDPLAIADWAFRTFNADLDLLETERHNPGGETTFLAACVYRLLGHRSLSFPGERACCGWSCCAGGAPVSGSLGLANRGAAFEKLSVAFTMLGWCFRIMVAAWSGRCTGRPVVRRCRAG